MSRKHYTEAASILAAERARNTDSPRTLDALDRVGRDLADMFKADNGRFDRARFYAACGMEDC